jgi:hypothetical protein
MVVIWSSGDREVAKKMVFMYFKNLRLKGWWGRVRIVVWGPSAQLLEHGPGAQRGTGRFEGSGVELQARKPCADLYGVADKLKSLGIEVIYLGFP